VTPEDAAATTTLLRAPAAIVAAAFLVGLMAGEAAVWDPTFRAAVPTVLQGLAIGLVCLPFLLPSRWYRSGRSGMRAWMWAAVLAASIRTVYVCGSLYPLQPVQTWLSVTSLHAAQLGTLWLAVLAVRWSVGRV
jgi:hypothetical protein